MEKTEYYKKKNIRRKKKINKVKLAVLVLFCIAFVVGVVCLLKMVFSADKTKQLPRSGIGASEQQVNTIKNENKKVNTGSLSGNIKATPQPHLYSIRIVKNEHKLYLLDHDEPVAVWTCAIGKGGLGQKVKSGDNMTPTGVFKVDEIDDASSWTHNFGDGKGEIKHAYVDWFISLDTNALSKGKWDGIGIHGTHDPKSVGTNASEGCVRLENANLSKLRKCVKVGTKVTIED